MSKLSILSIIVLGMAGYVLAGEVTLVKEGKPVCSIVLPEGATLAEQRGAREIQAHIRQMSGAELPILNNPQPLPPAAILVGLGDKVDGLGPEGFVLKTTGQQIIIAGGRPRGTMYGCTVFLEKLGVRWYTPKVTVTPQRATIVVPDLDEKQAPAFEYREPYFTEALDKDWAARLRCNGHMQRLDDSTGGKIRYNPFVHSFDDLIPRSLYASHPEYFSFIKGQRKDGYVQRCLSNPDVLRLTIEKVREWIARRPDATIISVSQNDTYQFCECDKCKEIEKQYGGVHAGVYLWFVNKVAEAIEKDHPDKLIDTLAYQFTEEPPTNLVPRKNVRVRLCPIAVCEGHPYEKCSFEKTAAFAKNLAAWAKITDTLYIWHYNTNFAHYLLPFPDYDQFPDSTRLYQRSGVKGIFFEGAYGGGGGGSDAELRSYVMAKLMWDPKLDSNALVNEWIRGVYGPAAKPMRQWFDLLHEKARNPDKHFFIYSPPTIFYLSPDVLAEGDKLFDEAEKLAAGNAIAAEYIAKARLGLRYAKLAQKPERAAFDGFVADVKKFGIRQISEGKTVEVWEKDFLKRLEKK